MTALRQVPGGVHVDEDVVAIARETRSAGHVEVDVSPRGTQRLLEAARAYSAISGRPYVTPDDVVRVCQPVLAHRLVLTPGASVTGIQPSRVVDDALESVPVPTVE